MKNHPKTKSEKIRELLRSGSLSQGQIAKKLGVSRQLVYMINRKLKKTGEVTPVPKGKRGRPKKGKWVDVVVPAEAFLPDPIPADLVSHPPHYTAGGIETLDFIEAKDLNYRLGNAIKYISRAGKKADGDPIQDLEKAAFYLNREIIIRKGA